MISSVESNSMALSKTLPDSLIYGQWPTALAPMQDITGLAFMEVVARRGPPDFFFTEFFRVHASSKIDEEILSSVIQNPTNQPVFAQLIGENIGDLKRTVQEFKQYPVSGIDLNLGCPAPRVFRKNVGGGLLRFPKKIYEILKMLREEVDSLLSVKMRIGFEDDLFFDQLLEIMNESKVDLLSLHARTVLGGYRSQPSYLHVRKAAEVLNCPVLLNGNVTSFNSAIRLKQSTGAHGIMIGRSAIRNPWIFKQIRQKQKGSVIFKPKLANVYEYIEELYFSLEKPNVSEIKNVSRMKKFLNFVGLSVDAEGNFLHDMRRTQTRKELFGVCSNHLLNDHRGETYFNPEPYDGLIARPSSDSAYAKCNLG